MYITSHKNMIAFIFKIICINIFNKKVTDFIQNGLEYFVSLIVIVLFNCVEKNWYIVVNVSFRTFQIKSW